MFDYNTGREDLKLREFGRNVQKLANHLLTIEDTEKRSRYAAGLMELMKQVVPSIKDNPEDNQRLWDDLHIMTDFKLEVEGPYERPEPHLQAKKPQRVGYNNHKIGFRHYGFNLELMVEEALKMEDPEQKEAAIIHIGKLMKSYHATWNKENIDDEVLVKNLGIMSDGALAIDIEKVKEENLFEPLYKEKVKTPTNRFKKGNGHKPQKRRRN